MTKSAAICQYLVSRHGPSPLDVAPEEPGYAAFLNGLPFGEATRTFPQTLILRYQRLDYRARLSDRPAYARSRAAREAALMTQHVMPTDFGDRTSFCPYRRPRCGPLGFD